MSTTLTSPTLRFVSPPPGLAPLTDFLLTEVAGAPGLYSLEATVHASTRLFVLDASIFLPNYTPEISSEESKSLTLDTPDDALVLVVVNPQEHATTVNLMAPIVVNIRTGLCSQVILDDQNWPMQAQLG